MRVVIQRVTEASVTVAGTVTGAIGPGLLVLVGIEDADTEADVAWLSRKIVQLRIFNDAAGLMNASLLETGGELLLVSQFTLHAATRKGARPSFLKASKPPVAIPLYNRFAEQLTLELGKPVACGVFGADMKVRLLNDGPVTIFIDSQTRE